MGRIPRQDQVFPSAGATQRACLQLDLVHGAAAEMLAAAWAGLGAPTEEAVRALRSLGLPEPSLVVEQVESGMWRAHRAHLRLGSVVLWPRTAAPVEPGPSVSSRKGPRGVGADVQRAWARGDTMAADALVAFVACAELPPIPRALADRAARLAVEALHQAAARPQLPASAVVRLACGILVNAALVAALEPLAVTCSPVGVSTQVASTDELWGPSAGLVPSPWLIALASGVPTMEHDVAAVMSDVAGLAVVRAVTSRFAARAITSTSSQALGVGDAVLPGRFVGVRARLEAPPAVASRSGESRSEAALVVEAAFEGTFDRLTLAAALGPLPVRHGALLEQRALEGDAARRLVRLVVRPEHLDAVTAALWSAGAVDVVTVWVEVASAAVADVTVPVGTARTPLAVRVRVTRDGERLLRVEPDAEDVRLAAGRLRQHPQEVAAQAIVAWGRLSGSPAHGVVCPTSRRALDRAPKSGTRRGRRVEEGALRQEKRHDDEHR